MNLRNSFKERVRFVIFEKNANRLKNYEKRPKSFKLEANKFAHLTEDELNTRYLSKINITELKKFTNTTTKVKINSTKNNYARLTGKNTIVAVRSMLGVSSSSSWVNINWALYGYISPVLDQGGCGACYAFTAVNKYL